MNEMDVKQEIYEDNSSHNSNESKEDGLLLNSLKPIKQEVLEDDSCKRQSNENEDLKWLDCKNGIKTEPHSDINTSSIIGYVDNNCLHQIKTEEDICDIKTEEVEHGEDQDEQMHNEGISTRKRAQWSEEVIKAAMNAVRNGMSVHKASVTFNIPRRTLRNHLASGSTQKRLGRPPILTKPQEDELVRHIERLCDVGTPLTPKILRKNMYDFVKEAGISHPFLVRKEIAGKKWMRLFFSRHPDIAKRCAQNSTWSETKN